MCTIKVYTRTQAMNYGSAGACYACNKAAPRENLSSGFPPKLDSNQPA